METTPVIQREATMNAIRVRKRFDLHGNNRRDLQERLAGFCEVVRGQRGTILDIQEDTSNSVHRASVLYQVWLEIDGLDTSAA
jgi:hypothetical protein